MATIYASEVAAKNRQQGNLHHQWGGWFNSTNKSEMDIFVGTWISNTDSTRKPIQCGGWGGASWGKVWIYKYENGEYQYKGEHYSGTNSNTSQEFDYGPGKYKFRYVIAGVFLAINKEMFVNIWPYQCNISSGQYICHHVNYSTGLGRDNIGTAINTSNAYDYRCWGETSL